jgi:hypothetical protein
MYNFMNNKLFDLWNWTYFKCFTWRQQAAICCHKTQEQMSLNYYFSLFDVDEMSFYFLKYK